MAVGLLGTVACAGKRPQIKVIGVSESATKPSVRDPLLVMFVEVVNPTGRDLRLSRLEYRFEADYGSSRGKVPLGRAVRAGASAVVEIPVSLEGVVPAKASSYILEGRLVARDNRLERSWEVKARGTLSRHSLRGHQVRLKVADANADAED